MSEVIVDQRVQQGDVPDVEVRQHKAKIGERSAAEFDDPREGPTRKGLIAAEVVLVVVIPVVVGIDQVGHPSFSLVALGFLPTGAVHLNDALLSQVLEVVAFSQAFNGCGTFQYSNIGIDEDGAWLRLRAAVSEAWHIGIDGIGWGLFDASSRSIIC